jgi:hypothetical protein
MEWSKPEAGWGKMGCAPSVEKEGNWRLDVWLECMMPPLGKKTGMLGLARRLL